MEGINDRVSQPEQGTLHNYANDSSTKSALQGYPDGPSVTGYLLSPGLDLDAVVASVSRLFLH